MTGKKYEDAFYKAYAHTAAFEGGYANVSGDTGGETYKGISRNNWPKWKGWSLIDAHKKAGNRTAASINARFNKDPEMTALVEEFYYVQFWNKIK